MARKFLYVNAVLIVLVMLGLLALRLWADKLSAIAFVPRSEFAAAAPLPARGYDDPALWIARPGMTGTNPAQWMPKGVTEDADRLNAAVFFIHPTSYFANTGWNAPIDDADSRNAADRFVQQIASPFNRAGDVWAPRYRQATFGAFLTDDAAGRKAVNLAYSDIVRAFAAFADAAGPDRPIVLAGHSQGALLLKRLLAEEVKGTPLQKRLVAAYVIGWPVSLAHDVDALGLPPCSAPTQTGCLVSWQSFAEPADTDGVTQGAQRQGWLDGSHGDGRPYLCSNPLTGGTGGSAAAAGNTGTLLTGSAEGAGSLRQGMIPARCDADGFLLIGPPPDLGEFVLPGNNYHVYDIPMFWRNLRSDVEGRVRAWTGPR